MTWGGVDEVAAADVGTAVRALGKAPAEDQLKVGEPGLAWGIKGDPS